MKAKTPATGQGRRIEQARLRAGISKGELCRQAPIDPSHLGRIYAGENPLTLRKAKQIAAVLDVDPIWLLTDAPEPKEAPEDPDAHHIETLGRWFHGLPVDVASLLFLLGNFLAKETRNTPLAELVSSMDLGTLAARSTRRRPQAAARRVGKRK